MKRESFSNLYLTDHHTSTIYGWLEEVMSGSPKILLIIGPMASGKTVLARALGRALGNDNPEIVLPELKEQVVLQIAQRKKPVIVDNTLRIDDNDRKMLMLLVNEGGIRLKGGFMSHAEEPPLITVPKVPVIITSLSEQFDEEFMAKCTVIYLEPIEHSKMVNGEECMHQMQFLFQKMIIQIDHQLHQQEAFGDGTATVQRINASENDHQVLTRACSIMSLIAIDIHHIWGIISIVQKHPDLFPAKLGSSVLKATHEFLMRYVAEQKRSK